MGASPHGGGPERHVARTTLVVPDQDVDLFDIGSPVGEALHVPDHVEAALR